MNKTSFALLIGLLLASLSFAQNTWKVKLPGFGYTDACIATSDGGVVVSTYLDHRVVKLDADGNILWSWFVDTTALQYTLDLIETRDQGILLSASKDGWDATLAFKLDKNGTLLWQREYTIPSSDFTASWLCPSASDAGFLIGGGECALKHFVIRCDSVGNVSWVQQYFGLSTAATGYLYDVVPGPAGTYYSTYNSNDNGDLDWGILKFDDAGAPLWARLLDEGPDRDEVIDMTPTAAGGFAVVGTTSNYTPSGVKMSFSVFDASGSITAYRTYSYSADLQPKAILQTADGGYIMTGSTFGLATFIVKTDALGSIQWQKLENGAASQEGFALAPAGGFMFYHAAFDFTNKATIGKYSSLSGLGTCSEAALSLSGSSHQIFPFTAVPSPFASSIGSAVVNYPHHTDLTAGTELCTSVAVAPAAAMEVRLSPVPVQGRLTVDLGAPLAAPGSLRVLDMQGRPCAARDVAPGESHIVWELPEMASGTYLLRLDGEGLHHGQAFVVHRP